MEMNHVILLFTLVGLSAQAEDWSYASEYQWPGECKEGRYQSPINIMTRQTLVDIHEAHIRGPLVFRGYKDVEVTAVNNGHTLKWNLVSSAPPPVVSGGPLRGNYSFMQFHLHWLSEHAIDGMKYPLEIHMVHIKTGLTLDEAIHRPDGLAVVGVLCQVKSGPESELPLEQLMDVVPQLLEKTEYQSEPMHVDLTRLLSPNLQSYYTYHGSLTTPTCDEAVTWIVMDKPLDISDEHYKQISQANVGGIDNYRSLQPVNRVIYRSIASCASFFKPSLFGTMGSLFSCLSSTLSAGVTKSICLVGNLKRKFLGNGISDCVKYT